MFRVPRGTLNMFFNHDLFHRKFVFLNELRMKSLIISITTKTKYVLKCWRKNEWSVEQRNSKNNPGD